MRLIELHYITNFVLRAGIASMSWSGMSYDMEVCCYFFFV